MARAAAIDDLFGHVPQRGELDIAAGAPAEPVDETSENGLIAGLMRPPPGGHTADTVRQQIMMVLNAARAASVMPWSQRQLQIYTGGFPFWAEWLKNGEGERLLHEFKAEMDRLQAPVDEVAPNWREIWGLDRG